MFGQRRRPGPDPDQFASGRVLTLEPEPRCAATTVISMQRQRSRRHRGEQVHRRTPHHCGLAELHQPAALEHGDRAGERFDVRAVVGRHQRGHLVAGLQHGESRLASGHGAARRALRTARRAAARSGPVRALARSAPSAARRPTASPVHDASAARCAALSPRRRHAGGSRRSPCAERRAGTTRCVAPRGARSAPASGRPCRRRARPASHG